MIDEEAAIVRKMWTVQAITRKIFHWLCCVEALYPKMEYCNRNLFDLVSGVSLILD